MAQLFKDKKSLREWAKEERKKHKCDDMLISKLCQTTEYKNAKNIMIFYPLEHEINLLPLLEDKTKNFFLPKIEGENLLCCSYKKGDELCKSCFKTQEPLSEPSPSDILDLVIVPALAVDKNKYRLGYGGGFYDRFLRNIKAKKTVCISKALVVETIYPEDTDVFVDIVITA